MRASKWDVLPEKQHQFYTTSGDIPSADTWAGRAAAGSNQVACGWQGVAGSWQSYKVGWEPFLARGRMLHKPQNSGPSASCPLSQESWSSERGGRELPWANCWGRKKQEESTAWFISCMERVGEGNLVVNGNRWASSQAKRWKKNAKTIFGRMVRMKAGKLREGETFSLLGWKVSF